MVVKTVVVLLMALVVVCLAVSADSIAASHKTIVIVGGDHTYPPYEFLDQDGNPAGFNVELTEAIAEVMGFEVEIRLGKWDDMRRALDDRSVDVLQGTIQSEVRRNKFEFSLPHSTVHQSVFARRGAGQISEPAQLEGKEVVLQKGGFMHDYLVKHHIRANLFLVDTHAEAMRQLSSGKRDYALVANLPGLYYSRELGLSNIVVVGRLFSGQPYGYAARKGNTELISQFNEGLAILRNTGRYHKIHNKWLGSLEPYAVSWKTVIKYVAVTALPLLLILAGIVIWNRALQREVSRRATEIQSQQQQLIQADKMASLGILVSGVAHEINNPTGLLLYNLPALKKIYSVVEKQLEERYRQEGDFVISGVLYSQLRDNLPCMIDEMYAGATRIKRIVEDLKDFARKDTSKLDENVLLNDVVTAALRLVDNSIKKSAGSLEVTLADYLPVFRGNSQRIEQVIVNLILNACQALPNPGKRISVSTGFDPEKDMIELRIQDEGIGINPENLPHIADPFFTTRRDSGGTGLGLSVSAAIIKEHNGSIEFDSLPGQGTTVRVWLPVVKGVQLQW